MSRVERIATQAAQERLESLIEQRLEPGADKELIDARIWNLFGERWAVMFTDLAGFSRQVAEFGIIHFLQIIQESQRILVPCIEDHDGILLKTEGDSMLVIFRSPLKGMECALAMQRRARDYNANHEDVEKVLLCIGLGFGKMLHVGQHEVFGAEVNAAAKLGEDTAKAWEILVTDAVRQSVLAADPPIEPLEFVPLDEAPPGAESAFSISYEL